MIKLQKKGLKPATILKELRELQGLDPDYKNHKLFSLVYYLGDGYTKFLNDAYHLYFSANGLNPGAFRSLKEIENRVVSITADLLHGDQETCGVVTSGGTESCLLAVKTYRDFAKKERRVHRPNMVIPDTAHVAWIKAAEYFNVKMHRISTQPDKGLDIQAVKKKIDRNTIMILGSAPEYPHGLIDPIESLGELAQSRNIPLHVDACVGGFLLPFIEKLGHELPLWDFRVPGVTSISADIHKYGFAAKGASTILYRSQKHFEYQVFVFTDWAGGIFASPALLGTRPGGAYAGAYAALMVNGEQGYLTLTQQALTAAKKLKEGITRLGLKIVGEPKATLFAVQSPDPGLDIFVVADLMEKKGWYIDRIQKPDALHAMVTPGHEKIVTRYLRDLKAAIQVARAHPGLSSKGQAATYGMLSHVPFRGLVKKQVLKMFASTYRISGGELNLESQEFGEGEVSSAKPPLFERFALWLAQRSRKKAAKESSKTKRPV